MPPVVGLSKKGRSRVMVIRLCKIGKVKSRDWEDV
jgi:hypothetical protein